MKEQIEMERKGLKRWEKKKVREKKAMVRVREDEKEKCGEKEEMKTRQQL